MHGARTGADIPLLGGFKWLPWGRPFAMRLIGWVKHNIGIQALWGLMTIVKQPGEIAAGTLKPSHMYIVSFTIPTFLVFPYMVFSILHG